MPIQIEFQIAGLITTAILLMVFVRRIKWTSPQNTTYKILLTLTFFINIVDILSVSLIDNRDIYPVLNNFAGKLYLLLMLCYIVAIDCYAMICTIDKKISPGRKKVKIFIMVMIGVAAVLVAILICTTTLHFAGYKRATYSYGFPSDLIYVFSTCSVVYVIITLLVNVRHIRFSKMLSIFSFCVMEGVIAIVQMFNKELLLVSFGCSMTVFIMYFTVENPDAQAVSRLFKANRRARDLLRNVSISSMNGGIMDSSDLVRKVFPDATILVIDVVDYIGFSNRMGIERFTKYLNSIVEKIDTICDGFNIEKIRNIGPGYLAVAGIPYEFNSNVSEMMRFAVEIMNIVKKTNLSSGMNLQFRIGMANGPVLAELVGKQSFIYNIYGPVCTMAMMLQNTAAPNTIHVSENVYDRLNGRYKFVEAEEHNFESVGCVKTYALEF